MFNHPTLLKEIIYAHDDPQKMEFDCPQCLTRILTTVDEVKENNRLICSQCGKERIIDIEDILKRRELILKTVSDRTKF